MFQYCHHNSKLLYLLHILIYYTLSQKVVFHGIYCSFQLRRYIQVQNLWQSLSGWYCFLEWNKIFLSSHQPTSFWIWNVFGFINGTFRVRAEREIDREKIFCRKIETVLAQYKYRRQKIRKRAYHSLASFYQQGYLECALVMVLPYYHTVIKYTRHFSSSLHLHNNRWEEYRAWAFIKISILHWRSIVIY